MEKLIFAQKTDKGKVRYRNEDSIGYAGLDEGLGKGTLFVIADGLGGLEQGDKASRMAMEKVLELFHDAREIEGVGWFAEAFRSASSQVYDYARSLGLRQGMATTLTASLFIGDRLLIGHVGDCRVYRLRQGKFISLTNDHTISRNVLTRTVGSRLRVDTDTYSSDLRAGDRYLQCSDGLHAVASAEEMIKILQSSSPEDACEELVTLANAKGGPDNISVQIIRVATRDF